MLNRLQDEGLEISTHWSTDVILVIDSPPDYETETVKVLLADLDPPAGPEPDLVTYTCFRCGSKAQVDRNQPKDWWKPIEGWVFPDGTCASCSAPATP